MNDKINKLVHQAMGLCIHTGNTADMVFQCETCHEPINNFSGQKWKPPRYSEDLNAAFKFVEKLIADGFRFACEWDDWGLGKWAVKVNEFVRSDRSLATAICRCGLSALGISVSPEEAKRSV